MGRVLAGVSARRMLALYGGIAIVLPVAFWAVRDVPASWGCDDSEPLGHDAVVEAFEAGAIPLHATAAVLLLAALWLWSAKRRGGRPGWPTLAAVVVLGAYLVVTLVENSAYEIYGIYAYLAAFVLVPLGAIVLLVAGLVAWRRPRWRGTIAYGAVAGAGWLLLMVAVPFHLDLVYLQGDGPWFCFD